ncbi:MAG TPA: hypothetical protein VIF57_03230 [Polyangia bacterium]|jgi:hypothetical protein
MQTSKAKTTRALDDAPATAGGAPGTSGRHAIKTTRAIAVESAVGVAATLAIAALCGVPYLGLGSIDPHPVWLVVLVIAARYGTHGLGVVLPIAWGALALATAGDGPGRVLDTLAMPVDLGALAGTVLVAWIASGNERRERTLAGKVEALEQRAAADGATIGDLRRAALALRARNDRLDLSLTFLRAIARRLHGADPEAAAQAALELIGARIGARAASVELVADGALRQLAVIGIWNRDAPDRTALAVLASGQPSRALELAEGGPADSDIAAPIRDGAGQLRGVVAARGVPGGGSSMAALRDLTVIADWASPALCDAFSSPPDALEDGDRRGPDADSDGTGEAEEREPAPLTVSPAHV